MQNAMWDSVPFTATAYLSSSYVVAKKSSGQKIRRSGDHDAKPVVDNGDGLDEDCRYHVGATDVQQKL